MDNRNKIALLIIICLKQKQQNLKITNLKSCTRHVFRVFKMKKIFLILIAIIGFGISANAQTTNFSGNWIWWNSNKSSNFTLALKQKGNNLSGNYGAVAANGNKIDEGEDASENKISGTISNGTATVKFVSDSWGGFGRATIKLLPGNKIEWTIISQSGEHYAPKKAILMRE
jgi:hypothetical protein